MDGVRPAGPTGMSREMRKRVLMVLAVVVAAVFVAGGVAAFMSRNDTICSDGKVPLRQRDIGMGQTQYWCHNGELVTK
jgi:vancomycin permeability regulator SanA